MSPITERAKSTIHDGVYHSFDDVRLGFHLDCVSMIQTATGALMNG